MKRLKLFLAAIVILALTGACKKSNCGDDKDYVYYEVGFKSRKSDWRDTSFVVRTKNEALIQQVNAQLALPVQERKLVVGTLVEGSGGYNKNATHEFKWHFREDEWQLADITIEIYDGRPYTDIDLNLPYWLNTVKRFGPWSSYISRKLPGKPS
jgi:hypothetical protein